MTSVSVSDIEIGNQQGLTVIAGPCAIESEALNLRAAHELKEIFTTLGVPFIFKSSFDKANRSSLNSFRGPGMTEGLRILKAIKEEVGVPVVTDIHDASQAAPVAQVCDLIQIPAFLCRQTDLLVAAAQTGRPLMVKKGQFMAPWDMQNVVNKIYEGGNQQVILTDRGTSFGYNNLVSDFRGIPIMKSLGVPVCYDASHSVQLPGGQGHASGGQKEFVATLAKAAVAAGCDCIFLETHPNPNEAKCDGSSMIPFSELPELIHTLKSLYEVVNSPCFAGC